MKNKLIALILISFQALSAYSQDTDYRELFLAAESYFLFEEFSEALPLYLRIQRHNPDNDNVNFKIGVCYLNDPYQKNKSVTYLERAVENINPRFRENNFKEKAAPPEALFYLGNAYRVNNQLEKAKEYYLLFLASMDTDVYDEELVNDQIEACNVAQKLMKKPIDFDSENVGDKINTRFSDINPVVSGDETKMVFISKLQFYDAVFFTEKVDGEWTPPRNIIPELGVDGDVYPTSLSFNGSEMFVYRNDNFIGNLYSSTYINGEWTALKKLNDNINTRFWESHASISEDGKSLYFSSNRRGGYGGLDIYKSERQENGNWGPAINLGSVINSQYNDDTPFITGSEAKLFFSSYGHYNMGGYDIFMSKLNNNGEWSQPVNIGYPVNTTDDNQFFLPLKDGQVAYYSHYDTRGGYGKHDIFRYEIYSPDYPRMFSIEGLVDFLGVESVPGEVDIMVVAEDAKDTLHFLHPDQNNKFSFEVPAGSYEIVFDSERFRQEILKLDVTPETPHTGLVLTTPVILALKPPSISVEDLKELLTIREDSVIYVEEGEEARIRYNAEKGSIVVVDVYKDSVLLSSDSIQIDRRRQRYVFDPEPGENEVRLSLTDQDGNSVSKSIKVIDLGVPKTDFADEESEIIENPEVTGEIEGLKEAGEILTAGLAIAELIHELAEKADGELENYLDNLDPSAENIESRDDLIDHLYEASEREDFTSGEVSRLLLEAGMLNELQALIREIAELSTPALKEYLLDIDPDEEGINSEGQLIDHLLQKSGTEAFTRMDVIDALAKYYNQKDIQRLIEELLEHSDGDLHDYLLRLNPREENIMNFHDLFRNLLDNAENNNYTVEEVIDMLESYFALEGVDSLSLLNSLKESSDDEIKEFIENINEQNYSGINREEFYNSLLNDAEGEGVDIIQLLIDALNAEGINPENLKLYFKDYAGEGVQSSLETISGEISLPGDLFSYLIDKSETNSDINKEELIDLVEEYLANKDFYEFYYDMLRNSENDLQSGLKAIKIRDNQLSGRKDLLNQLSEFIENNDLSIDNLYNAQNGAYTDAYILNLIKRLIQIADNGLETALRELNPVKHNIESLGDIIAYLLEETETYGYTEQDVYELIREYFSTDFSSDKGRKLLTSDDDELLEDLSNGAKWTAGILILEGILILILILFARKKKKKKQDVISKS